MQRATMKIVHSANGNGVSLALGPEALQRQKLPVTPVGQRTVAPARRQHLSIIAM